MKGPDAGASLIETLVAFGLTVAVSTFALSLFGLHQRLARAQLEDSSLQEAQRASSALQGDQWNAVVGRAFVLHGDGDRVLRARGEMTDAQPMQGGVEPQLPH